MSVCSVDKVSLTLDGRVDFFNFELNLRVDLLLLLKLLLALADFLIDQLLVITPL